jgi:hypothetical protein
MLLAAVPAWAGEVKVSFSNGRVTIAATDASPRQILAEWARQGQVRITNLERLVGGPVTLQLTDVPEAQALGTLLRGTAGYVAAPRGESVAAASSYDRILLLPGAAPTMPVPGPASSPASNMGFGRGRPSGPPAFDPAADDDAEPVVQAPGTGRDGGGRPGTPNRQITPGPLVMPGLSQGQGGYLAMPNTQSPGAAQQAPFTQPFPDPQTTTQRQPSAAGASVPGVMTTPQTIQTTPYSNDGPPPQAIPQNPSAPMPGQVTAQPGQTGGGLVGGSRPGESTAPAPVTIQNPYGLPEPLRPPVVNPNGNPYGLPNPVKQPTPTPTATIKKSGGGGGQN